MPGRPLADLRWRILGLGRTRQGRAWGVPWFWLEWERLMLRTHPVTPARAGALFSFRVVSHHGRPVTLADGSRVADGDRILQLHLDSRELTRLRREPGYSTWKAVHRLREDLAALALKVRTGELGQVGAVKGVSLMGEAGGVLGFEARPLPHSLAAGLQQYFMAGIDSVYHPAGLQRLGGRMRRRWPVESWMSAGALLRRYEPAGEKSWRSTVAR